MSDLGSSDHQNVLISNYGRQVDVLAIAIRPAAVSLARAESGVTGLVRLSRQKQAKRTERDLVHAPLTFFK